MSSTENVTCLETDLNVGDMFTVPARRYERIVEAHDQKVLGHFFPKIMINAVDLQRKFHMRQRQKLFTTC